jgi:hypothetical protein
MYKTNKHKTRKQRFHDKNRKFAPSVCTDQMKFQDCELAILREAVDESEQNKGREISNSEEIRNILTIVEDFIRKKKVLLYGGIAINNILPKYAQFYDFTKEVPDYDFYSPDALKHAKELTDIYYKAGYVEVEAKAGIHMGTFKVFVNFIPIADITQLHHRLYDNLFKDAIVISEMHYTPPNYLRMSMYLELSRPAGDLSRWEKVFKRLSLLNKYFPFTPTHMSQIRCHEIDFHKSVVPNSDLNDALYDEVRDNFIDQGVIFFGGYATSLYSHYMPIEFQMKVKKYPDFDVLSEEPEKCAVILKEHLQRFDFKHIKLIKHHEIGEIIPYHIEVQVNNKTIAFIYKPIACHSYNKIMIKNQEINVATIDTILTFYLSFWYANLKYYDKDRLMCMAKYLFEVEQHNRLSQRGLLKRFSIDCYGKQMTLSDLRAEKARKYRELANNRNSAEYEMWFLKYYPQQQGSREPTVPSGRFQRPRWSPEGAQSLRPLPSKKQLSLKASHEDSDMKSVEKEDKDSEETSLEKAVKEQSFIESFIGSPKQSKKSSKKSERTSVVSPIVTFLRKTQKNKTGEFLF